MLDGTRSKRKPHPYRKPPRLSAVCLRWKRSAAETLGAFRYDGGRLFDFCQRTNRRGLSKRRNKIQNNGQVIVNDHVMFRFFIRTANMPQDQQRLKRLPPEYYRGLAWVHWTLTIEERKTGWLDARFLYKFREIVAHAALRYQFACPTSV